MFRYETVLIDLNICRLDKADEILTGLVGKLEQNSTAVELEDDADAGHRLDVRHLENDKYKLKIVIIAIVNHTVIIVFQFGKCSSIVILPVTQSIYLTDINKNFN